MFEERKGIASTTTALLVIIVILIGTGVYFVTTEGEGSFRSTILERGEDVQRFS